MLIPGDITNISDDNVTLLGNYVGDGRKFLVTGAVLTNDANELPVNKIRLKSLLFHVNYI